MIDCSEEDVEERFRTIDRELALYGAGPRRAAADRRAEQDRPAARAGPLPVEDERIVGVFRVSCATGAGIDDLKRALFELCPAAPRADAEEDAPELPDFLDYRPQPPGAPDVPDLRTDRGFRVVGEAPEGEELEAALRAAGARKGQDVEIGDEVLEWQ